MVNKDVSFYDYVEYYYNLPHDQRTPAFDEFIKGQSVTWTGTVMTDGVWSTKLVLYGKEDGYTGETWDELQKNSPHLVPCVFIVKVKHPHTLSDLKPGQLVTVTGEIGARGDKELNYHWKLYEGKIISPDVNNLSTFNRRSNMKEIIYLDTEMVNSMLAQLGQGLVVSYSFEVNSQETQSVGQQSTKGKNAGLNGHVNADSGALPGGGIRFGASIGRQGSEGTNESQSFTEGEKDLLNKAFHDHAIELLIEKLIENELLSEEPLNKEGEIQLSEEKYRFYDFDLIEKAMDPIAMEKIMLSEVNQLGMSHEEATRIINKKNPNAQERELKAIAEIVVNAHNEIKPVIQIYKQMNVFSKYALSLLHGLTLIKAGNKIGLIKKEYLRESTASLSFRTDKSRKVKLLVRIIGKKEIVYDGNNLPNFMEDDLDIIPTMTLDILLGAFKIIKKGDLLVAPIAIYYE